jgi:exo-beta-1,3-glucanase (GH17 family)
MIISTTHNRQTGRGIFYYLLLLSVIIVGCEQKKTNNIPQVAMNAKAILGDSTYQAISYGGYRATSRDTQPSIEELKEDMLLMSAMGIKLIRTYNVTRPHASNVLKAITELKKENESFEMYVMLGAWIDCKNAWTDKAPDHNEESAKNASEIDRAVNLANQYPDIVKIVAVGNEAMVKWAASYYVQPGVILKWVNHLQSLKTKGELSKDLWITSSDNFASWGGGSDEYHVEDLNNLIKAVDFISMHTYPMHDTHYNADFWYASEGDLENKSEQIEAAMLRAKAYAESQYESVKAYMKSLGVEKPIHIGETGWASHSDGFYGPEGSRACDEYKQGLYHKHMRDWTNKAGLSCFYFQAIDEPWKDANNVNGSENHFGLFTVEGKAKYAIWDLVDKGIFKGLKRGGNTIVKTFNGDRNEMMKTVYNPALAKELIEE